MIKPLTIGNKSFPINIVQGPLAGISTGAFRSLASRYSRPAFSYSEMISANALVKSHKLTRQRFLYKAADEGALCFQLFGNTQKELTEASKILTEHGADLIDFNCGCSVPKIRGNGSGSGLLLDRPKLYKLLTALRQSTPLPLLVKIRVATDSELVNREIATVINDSGVDGAVVHGRSSDENYSTPCHYDLIQFFVSELKNPVIGNGDIRCSDSLKKMLATGCAGVMISRALVGQPWLISKLIAEINGEYFSLPTAKEIGELFILHVAKLAEIIMSSKMAVIQARKLAKSYAASLKDRKEFCSLINSCDSFLEFQQLCQKYFG